METRIGRLRARWLVLVLGGILLATTVLFGPVTNAEAQGQSQAKGKSQGKVQGQVQGQENGTANGLGHQKVAVCHKPGGETTDEESAEETGHILYLPPPAVDAHLRHGDSLIEDTPDENGVVGSGECGSSGENPDPEDCLAAGTSVAVEKGVGNTGTTVEQGDVLTIEGDFELATTGTVSITLQNPTDGEPVEFVDGVNAEITEDTTTGTLLITVGEDVPDLDVADLEVVSSDGITCPEDTGEESDLETLTGTLATTRSGDVALRTKDGKGGSKAVPLVTQTQDQEKRLEELAASKLGKVKVTGAKVKNKSATKVKGAKVKEERKEALRVTSVKKANKKK